MLDLASVILFYIFAFYAFLFFSCIYVFYFVYDALFAFTFSSVLKGKHPSENFVFWFLENDISSIISHFLFQ